MAKKKILFFFILSLVIFFLSTGPCFAKMVSIAKEGVNLRSGPATSSKVVWRLGRGYPLQVLESRGKWYKVRDFENDEGWVYQPLTSSQPHMVVKKKIINIRKGPGTKYRIVGQAKHGVVFHTVRQVKGWVEVRHKSGLKGWVARPLVWGW